MEAALSGPLVSGIVIAIPFTLLLTSQGHWNDVSGGGGRFSGEFKRNLLVFNPNIYYIMIV